MGSLPPLHERHASGGWHLSRPHATPAFSHGLKFILSAAAGGVEGLG